MEFEIVKFFNRLGAGRFDKLADILSRLRFLVIFWIILSFGFLFFDKQNGSGIFWGIIIVNILHFAITEVLIKGFATKIWGKRVRPYIKYPEIKPIGRRFINSSFPSSHVATTAGMLSIIIFSYPNFWPLALLFVLAMAFARLYQGMHYASDVIAGIFFGIMYGWVGIYMLKILHKINIKGILDLC